MAGLKLTVVPLGAPEEDSAMALLNPPLTTVVMVDEPRLPCEIVKEAGEAEIVKLPPAVTVKPVLPK